jgi:3-phosphoshikimate 1-carboxyvinyltransferase
MRLLAGILAGQSFDSVLIGDGSLSKRPMGRIIEPLSKMGAVIHGENGHAPIRIQGGNPLRGMVHKTSVASAQVKSCILLAGLYGDGDTTVIESFLTRDHTERLLRRFGTDLTIADAGITVSGDSILTASNVRVPADVSAASFFIVAAACMNDSSITLPNVGLNPTRTAMLNLLGGLGLRLNVAISKEESNEPVGTVRIDAGSNELETVFLSGDIIPELIDELPVLAVLGTQLKGGIEVHDAEELRHKETDRIAAIVENLRRMNAVVEEFDDGFRVRRSTLRGSVVDSFGDHRIAMSMAVAGLLAEGVTEITNSECVDVSFPGFFETLEGAAVR